jgi:hypothetical protein
LRRQRKPQIHSIHPIFNQRNGCAGEKSVAPVAQRLRWREIRIFNRRNRFFDEKTAALAAQRLRNVENGISSGATDFSAARSVRTTRELLPSARQGPSGNAEPELRSLGVERLYDRAAAG